MPRGGCYTGCLLAGREISLTTFGAALRLDVVRVSEDPLISPRKGGSLERRGCGFRAVIERFLSPHSVMRE